MRLHFPHQLLDCATDHAVEDRTSLRHASLKIWEYRRMPPEISGRIVGGFNNSGVQRLLHGTKSPATARTIAKQTGQTKRPDWLAGATVQMAPCSARFPC